MAKKSKEPIQQPRFTPDDIVRAIEGVQMTGLEVREVEINLEGSIRIITGRASKTKADPQKDKTRDNEDEAQPTKTKKQA